MTFLKRLLTYYTREIRPVVKLGDINGGFKKQKAAERFVISQRKKKKSNGKGRNG